jgi:DNA-binding NarL/FixJ family response regulator
LAAGQKRIRGINLGFTSVETHGGMVMPVKIVLADNQKNIRDSLRALLDQDPHIEVVAEADSAITLVLLARTHKPDIVIMDIGMPDLPCVEASRCLLSDTPGLKVIVLSMHADKRYADRMLQAGISGYLLKDCACEELVDALLTVLSDEIYLSPGVGIAGGKLKREET